MGMIDPQDNFDADMAAYSSNPSLLQMMSPSAPSTPDPAGGLSASSSGSPVGQESDLDSLSMDTQTQLLEAILSELRTLNQNIREL